MVAWITIASAVELVCLTITIGLHANYTAVSTRFYFCVKDYCGYRYPYGGDYYWLRRSTSSYSASTIGSAYAYGASKRHTLHKRYIYADDRDELYAWVRADLGLAFMMLIVCLVRFITLVAYLIKYVSARRYDGQDARKRKSFQEAGLAADEDSSYGTNIHRQALRVLRPYFKANIWLLVLMFIFGMAFILFDGLIWGTYYKPFQAMIVFWAITFALTIVTTALILLEIKSIRRKGAARATDGDTTAGSKEVATTPNGTSIQPALPQAQQPQLLYSPPQQNAQMQASPLVPTTQSTQVPQVENHSTAGAALYSVATAGDGNSAGRPVDSRASQPHAVSAVSSSVAPAMPPNVFFDQASGKLYIATDEGLKPLSAS